MHTLFEEPLNNNPKPQTLVIMRKEVELDFLVHFSNIQPPGNGMTSGCWQTLLGLGFRFNRVLGQFLRHLLIRGISRQDRSHMHTPVQYNHCQEGPLKEASKLLRNSCIESLREFTGSMCLSPPCTKPLPTKEGTRRP